MKLPPTRVDGLVAAEEGARFDGGKGKPMKEWFAVDLNCSASTGPRLPTRH